MVRVAWRLGSMTSALVCIFELYKSTLSAAAHPPWLSVFDAVYMNCVLVLVSLSYYCVAKFCILSWCYSNPPLRRKHRLTWPITTARLNPPPFEDNSYEDDEPVVVRDAPSLSLQNVWILVYGLGIVFFVTGYCMLGLHPVCMACLGVAMGVLCLDELICPRFNLDATYVLMRYSALLVAIVSLLLVSADAVGAVVITYVATMDLYSIIFGLCFPFLSQLIMVVVRDAKGFSIGNAFQVCEFGFPFAAFLGVFHLSVAYGQRFQLSGSINEQLYEQHVSNITMPSIGVVHLDTPVILFYGLTPLLIIPCLYLYVTCTLEGCTIDPLISLSLALCIQHLILSPVGTASVLGIYGTICSVIGCVLRFFSEYKFIVSRSRASMHIQSDQLPHNVVWDRRFSTVEWERRPIVIPPVDDSTVPMVPLDSLDDANAR